MAIIVKPTVTAVRKSAAAIGVRSQPPRLWTYFRNYPVIPLAVLALLLIIAVIGASIAPYERDIGDLRDRHLRPFSTGYLPEGSVRPDHQISAWWPAGFHLLGTDHVGRDIFTRMLHGARISLLILALTLTTGVILGTLLGIVGGWFRGLVDEAITRTVDIWMALPFVMLATVVTLVFGRSVLVLILVLILVSWVTFIRIVRAETIRVKERDYVDIAKICGASRIWIIRKHILPHVMPTLLILASSAAAGLVTADAIINFLGLGFDRTIPSWGNLINEGRDFMVIAPHQFAAPSIALLILAFAFMFLGDWLRERLNPNLRSD